VNDAFDLSFESRGYRYDQPSVTHGGSGVFINEALLLGLSENLLHRLERPLRVVVISRLIAANSGEALSFSSQ
jgi:hypothetical protein